ncbi:hypothetical protein PN498_11485 [Oscillatoria sp. CS-180]|uniref:hypothetical protein n=1 Tax=Oscillatoria sp. CS-180 TaxID=3021720 RepID=UPI002330CC22|nr:hypothetical protein [Oscillatoria sp. CS-180]MDB9526615.1 hypothetical protein [Oscillatoria sp. CS-180]
MFTLTKVLSTACLFSAVVLSMPVHADSVDNADKLLPLETRSVVLEADPNLYATVAEDINAHSREQADPADDAEVLGADLLNQFVDEDGDVNLPLGLTVFEAMGTTSVGFGGDF